LAAVPETRGTPVVVLAPITVDAPLPAGFVDIDALVEQEEKDAVAKQSIAAGRQAVAENHYATQPRPLSYYRLRNGWSQKELAGRMGTSQSYIARLEAGDIDPQVSTLKRLAAVFDVQPAVLLDAMTAGATRS
jgi:ribosome-binding protein aMBF1 (putative translation factor)